MEKIIDINELVQDQHNFNKGTEEGQRLVEKSFKELGAGRSILIDKDGQIIAGNKSQKAAIAAGITKVRVIETTGDELVAVQRTDLSIDSAEGRALAYADNSTQQANLEWDMDEIEIVQSEVEGFDPSEWGGSVDMTDFIDKEAANAGKDEEKVPEAEEMLNKAMQQYCGEFVAQIDHAMKNGWICTGLTPGYAKIEFLKAKYYGYRYQRNNSLIFTPRQFLTSANDVSYYDTLVRAAKEGKAGIAGLRTITGDGNLCRLFSGNYPIAAARMPLDFPVELGRELIRLFANKGRVLDPCHGWGGRLTAALLEGVEEYVGVDPSPDAHDGVSKIYETFKEYQETKCTLIRQPYEDTKMGGGFDFALTSPPYFDVEQYAGEDQAHVKYVNYEKWREYFYRPLISLTMDRLKVGSVFALQVGSQSYPLRDDAIGIAKELGFSCEIWREHAADSGSTLHDTDAEKSECVILIHKN